jgi:hypothetical protein
LLKTIKRLSPAVVKQKVRNAQLQYRLWRAAGRIAALPPGVVPPQPLLRELLGSWGNEGFAADLSYLEALSAQAVATPGPVLECGTGATTILLGLLAGRRGIEIWSLENSPEWISRIQKALSRNRIPGVRLCYAPLRDYGGFDWYDAPVGHMPRDFRLVVCDGPPGFTPGGRYGLFPVMWGLLSRKAVVLVDDALRTSEMAVIEEWKRRWPLLVSPHQSGHGAYASISFSGREL